MHYQDGAAPGRHPPSTTGPDGLEQSRPPPHGGPVPVYSGEVEPQQRPLLTRATAEGAKEIFWTADATFKLMATRQTRMETRAEAQAEKEPRFAVAYPLSWSEEEVAGSDLNVSSIHMRLADAKGEALLAYVQAKLSNRAPGGGRRTWIDSGHPPSRSSGAPTCT
jgi:hypothetical protein